MIHPKFFSQLHPSGSKRRRPRCVFVRPQLEALEDRVVPSAEITLNLQNLTGLDPNQYSVFVAGYSFKSGMELTLNGNTGVFTLMPTVPQGQQGAIQSYNINDISSIQLNSATALAGGVFYFFVKPNSNGISPPTGPPINYTYDGAFHPIAPANPLSGNSIGQYGLYDIVEFTQTSGGVPDIDVTGVSEFVLPITLSLALNSQQWQVGPSPGVSREDILNAYSTFITSLKPNLGESGVEAYQDLVPTSSLAGQSDGIISPGNYLAAFEGGASDNILNSGGVSYFTHYWDQVLENLFYVPQSSTLPEPLTLQMIGDDGDYYAGTPTTVGSAYVLQFVGYTDQNETIPNGNVFNVYDPMTSDPNGPTPSEAAGQMVFNNDGVFADSSSDVILQSPPPPSPPSPPSQQTPAPSWTNTPNTTNPALPSTATLTLTVADGGKSVQWQYGTDGKNWNDLTEGQTIKGTTVNGVTSNTLTLSNVTPLINGDDFRAEFSDGSDSNAFAMLAPSTVVLGLERDIVAALNRGVALASPDQTGSGPAANSIYWGSETNWYPAGQTENLYSVFLHTGTVNGPNGTRLFTQPSGPGPATDAQGTPMGMAYGFGFDETPGHGPANQPNVPSEFTPGKYPTSYTAASGIPSFTITLDPWSASPFPSPSPSPSPSSASSSSSPTWTPALLFLAEDMFSLMVDSMASTFSNNPLFTQAADRAMNVYNDLLLLDNPALYTGLSGLQLAIYSNPYYGILWGLVGQAAGMDWAANSKDWGAWTQSVAHMVELELAFHMFDPPNQS